MMLLGKIITDFHLELLNHEKKKTYKKKNITQTFLEYHEHGTDLFSLTGHSRPSPGSEYR